MESAVPFRHRSIGRLEQRGGHRVAQGLDTGRGPV